MKKIPDKDGTGEKRMRKVRYLTDGKPYLTVASPAVREDMRYATIPSKAYIKQPERSLLPLALFCMIMSQQLAISLKLLPLPSRQMNYTVARARVPCRSSFSHFLKGS